MQPIAHTQYYPRQCVTGSYPYRIVPDAEMVLECLEQSLHDNREDHVVDLCSADNEISMQYPLAESAYRALQMRGTTIP
jgi:hypothetical protein